MMKALLYMQYMRYTSLRFDFINSEANSTERNELRTINDFYNIGVMQVALCKLPSASDLL